MDSNNVMQVLKEKIKGIKNFELIITILIMTIVLSIYMSSLKPSNKTKDDENYIGNMDSKTNSISSIETQEEKLSKKLSTIRGAGKVEVMITYISGKEVVTAMNTVETNVTTEEEDSGGGVRKVAQNDVNSQAVIMSGSDGTKPLVIKEVEPEIKGVIVIAEGAYDINVKLELLRAVQTALGVSSNKVEVFVMDENLIRREQ